MATTILCDKKVAACRNAQGEVFYLVFEQTYQKNDYPHRLDWSCKAFGTYEEVMEKIFCGAASCTNGMLKSRNGDIGPENYIKSWLREFDAPCKFAEDHEFVLEVSEKWRSTIPTSLWREAAAALSAIGREDIVHELSKDGGTKRVSLAKDFDVIRALYSVKALIAAWRLFEVEDCQIVRDASLAPNRVQQSERPNVTLPHFLKHGSNHYLIKEAGKSWQSSYWTRSVFDGFIMGEAYRAEMLAPGSSCRLIAQYGDRMATAPSFPSGTKVTITIAPEGVAECCVEDAKRLAKVLGIPEEVHSFTVEFHRLPEYEAWRLFDLHQLQLLWDVPECLDQPDVQVATMTQADMIF